MPCDQFSAKRQNKRQSSIDVVSGPPPKSPVSSSQDDVVPHIIVRLSHLQLGKFVSRPAKRVCNTICQQRKSRIPGFFILRASYRNRGAQLALIFEAAAALGRFERLGSSRMATRFTFFTADPACLEPRLCAAY